MPYSNEHSLEMAIMEIFEQAENFRKYTNN